MMEDHEFCDSCPGCRPVLIDPATGKPLPDDSPVMKAVNAFWDNRTSYAERRAFIEVTLKNSREPHELGLAMEMMTRLKGAVEKEMGGPLMPVYFVIGRCDCCRNHFDYPIRSEYENDNEQWAFEYGEPEHFEMTRQKHREFCRSCRAAMTAHDEEIRYDFA